MQKSSRSALLATAMMSAISAGAGAAPHSVTGLIGQLPTMDPRSAPSARNGRAPGARMANIRAARKARNVKRHRKACRS